MPAKGDDRSTVWMRGLVAAVACAQLLAGCATGSVRTADTHLPPVFEAPRPAPAGSASLEQWWRAYDDPQLTQLVEQALAESFDAKDALSKLAQARAVRSAALTGYNPQGAVTASGQKQTYEALHNGASAASLSTGGAGLGGATGFGGGGLNSENYTSSFTVSWELDLFGRRAAARRSADADLSAARFTYDAARWSLASTVADSLFQARGLAIQLDQANETVRIEQQLLDVARLKAQHGLAPTSDTSQAESNVQSSRAQAEALGAQLTAARRSLLLLVGRGVDPLASLPVPAEVGAPPPLPSLAPGELLFRRPDVREAQERVVSASGRLTLDQRALLPTFTFQPGAGLLQQGSSSANQFSYWSLGLNASLPVLDRPRLLAVVRQQRAVAEQAVIAYERSVQTAYGEAENAFVYFDSDQKRVVLLRAAETNASAAYDAKRIGYQRGFNDLQAALSAEAAWRQARVARAAAEVTLMQRSIQVFKALGGGWTPPPRAAV